MVGYEDRLLTKDRDIVADFKCVICGDHEESACHLFFQCDSIKMWLRDVKLWLGWKTRSEDLHEILRWIQRVRLTKFRK